MPRRNIEIDDELWRAVKAKAALNGWTLTEFFAKVLANGVNTDTKPAVPDWEAVRETVNSATQAAAKWTPQYRPVPKKGK